MLKFENLLAGGNYLRKRLGNSKYISKFAAQN